MKPLCICLFVLVTNAGMRRLTGRRSWESDGFGPYANRPLASVCRHPPGVKVVSGILLPRLGSPCKKTPSGMKLLRQRCFLPPLRSHSLDIAAKAAIAGIQSIWENAAKSHCAELRSPLLLTRGNVSQISAFRSSRRDDYFYMKVFH